MNFIPVSYETILTFREMYADYVYDDLQKYSSFIQSRNLTKDKLRAEALNFIYNAHSQVYLLQKDYNYCGFCVICASPKKIALYSDFHITEFYIAKKFRDKGLGSEAVEALLKDKSGQVVSLDILDCNLPAQKFWHKVFKKYGKDISKFPDKEADFTLHYFTVR